MRKRIECVAALILSGKCCLAAMLFAITLLGLHVNHAEPFSGTFPAAPIKGLQMRFEISNTRYVASSSGYYYDGMPWIELNLNSLGGSVTFSGALLVGKEAVEPGEEYADPFVSFWRDGNFTKYFYEVMHIDDLPSELPFSVTDSGISGFVYYTLKTEQFHVWVIFNKSSPTGDTDPLSKLGGQKNNPYVAHEGGKGAGRCSTMGMPNYWVNTSSLNVVVEDTVFSSSGLGPPFVATLTYNDQASENSMFGRCWAFSYESTVNQSCTDAILFKGSGQAITYLGDLCTVSPPVELTPPDGRYDRLTWYGDYWLLQEKGSHYVYRFDKFSTNQGRLTSVTDSDGNALLIAYNEDGTIKSVTDAAGRSTTFAYGSGKRCTTITFFDGRTSAFDYDADGRMTGAVDMEGFATSYEYNDDGFLTVMSAEGKKTTFSYPQYSTVISAVTDARGNKTTYEVISTNPRKVKVTDPAGNSTIYGSSSGLTTSITDPLSLTTSVEFDKGEPVTLTDARGGITRKSYDARGNVTQIVDPLGNITKFSYDTSDNLITGMDPIGEAWTYTYDSKNHLTMVTSPLGRKTVMAYDTKGQLVSLIDPAGHETTFEYDSFGNIANVTDPLTHTTTMTYDSSGINLTALTDPRGSTTQFEYDANQRLTKTINPDSSFWTNVYDCCAQASVTDENGHTVLMTRDELLNPIEITDAIGNITVRAYAENGMLGALTDPMGRTASFVYDASDRPISKVNPLNGFIGLAYDSNGNMTTLTDERGKKTTMTYDGNDRLLSTRDPLSSTVKTARDGVGRVSTLTNARGGTITFAYDADGYLIKKSYGGSTAATYEYDEAGNLVTVKDSIGTTTFAHDAGHRVTHIQYPDGHQISKTYDAAGNVESISYPDGLVVSYTYDSNNRMALTSWGEHSVRYTYDSVGNLIHEVRSNGTESLFEHDDNDRLARIAHKKGSSTFAEMSFVRDANGNTIQESRALPLSSRLPVAAQSVSFNDANQISQCNSDIYTYDADGNLVGVSGSTTLSAVYDHENRLTSLRLNGSTTTFSYDGLGNRARVGSSAQTKNHHFDEHGRLLFETNESGELLASYIYGRGGLKALANPGGDYYFYHFDKLGSTLALSDSGGDLSAAYAYLPSGEILKQTGSLANPFTYVGAYGVMDSGSGIFFMRSRYYDSGTGRFLQKDPTGLKGGINLYAYVENNPVNRIDPAGTGWLDWIFGGGSLLSDFDKAMEEKKAREAKINQMGILKAGEKGYVAHDAKVRGCDASRLGKKGARLTIEAPLNTVITVTPIGFVGKLAAGGAVDATFGSDDSKPQQPSKPTTPKSKDKESSPAQPEGFRPYTITIEDWENVGDPSQKD